MPERAAKPPRPGNRLVGSPPSAGGGERRRPHSAERGGDAAAVHGAQRPQPGAVGSAPARPGAWSLAAAGGIGGRRRRGVRDRQGVVARGVDGRAARRLRGPWRSMRRAPVRRPVRRLASGCDVGWTSGRRHAAFTPAARNRPSRKPGRRTLDACRKAMVQCGASACLTVAVLVAGPAGGRRVWEPAGRGRTAATGERRPDADPGAAAPLRARRWSGDSGLRLRRATASHRRRSASPASPGARASSRRPGTPTTCPACLR